MLLLRYIFFFILLFLMSIYFSYDEQRKQDATFTVKSMGIQLGINLGTAIVTMIGFSILRPVREAIHLYI